MDGTALAAAFILIMFFFQVQPGCFKSGNVTGTPQPFYATLQEDKRDWGFEQISTERMQKIIRQYNKSISDSETNRIIISVNRYGKEKNIDPRLILAIMARESRFDPEVVSPSGAVGLGQIMPLNYQELKISDPADIDQGTKGLVYYFCQKLEDWQGKSDQLGLALASYLQGTGAIKRNGEKYSGHTEIYVNDILKIRGTI